MAGGARPRISLAGVFPFYDGGDVVRFACAVPSTATGRIRPRALDESGRPVGWPSLVFDEHDEASPDGSSPHSRVATISLRVPAGTHSCGVEVSLRRGSEAISARLLVGSDEYDGTRERWCEGRLNAIDDMDYEKRLLAQRPGGEELADQRLKGADLPLRPLVSIVTPVFRTPPDFLRQMIDSVIAQSYEKWELVLVNVSGACPEVDEVLGAYEDERIRVIVAENKDISSNTNAGIAAARGDYVAFVDHDDFVEPDAFFRYVEAINAHPECDLLFCDEDYWGEVDGRELFFAPKFKPGWNPDLLYTYNYVCHMLCVSRRALELTDRSDAEVAAAQDYDLTFKAASVAREIVHVPRMLYHWRDHAASTARHRESKPYALVAGQKAIQRELDRRGLPATVEFGSTDFSYRVRYELPDPSPTASVVVVPRDGSDALDHMRTMALMRLCRVRTQVRRGTRNASFGRAVNEAIARSAGDLVVILDEDCNPPGRGWLDDLVAPFARPEVGCVGPLMCDQDDVIQSVGLVVRKDGSPLPVEQGLAPVDLGYMNVIRHSRDCTALSAGCLVMRRADVERIGPLDESLPETLCVEDYCLRLREHGLLVVCLASRFARRRTAWAAERRDAASWEAGLALVRSLHPQVADGDPYFSEAFDDSNGLFQLKKSGR